MAGNGPCLDSTSFSQIGFGGSKALDFDEKNMWLAFDNVLVEGVTNEIPEPATLSLLSLGGLALIRRRR